MILSKIIGQVILVAALAIGCSDKHTAATSETVAEKPVSTPTENAAAIDNTIAGYLDKIEYWRSNYDKDEDGDSLGDANTKLETYLMQQCINSPAVLTDSLSKAQTAGMSIVTSADGKVRFFSWDTESGGTMHYYNDMALYTTGKGIKGLSLNDTGDGGDPGYVYTNITDVHTNNGKTVYLVEGDGRYSTKDRGASITAYIINNGKLEKTPFFYTKTKQLDRIEYGYDLFAYEGEDSPPGIALGKDNQELYIPIVVGEKITNKHLVYKFDGNKFVFDKNAQ